MPDDNILSQKYRDFGIVWYFVTELVINNFSRNNKNSKKDKDGQVVNAAGNYTAESISTGWAKKPDHFFEVHNSFNCSFITLTYLFSNLPYFIEAQ